MLTGHVQQYVIAQRKARQTQRSTIENHLGKAHENAVQQRANDATLIAVVLDVPRYPKPSNSELSALRV